MGKLKFYPGTYSNTFNKEIESISNDLGFISTYNSPEKRQRYFNGKVASILQDNLGTHPFKQVETDDKSIQFEFNDKSKPLEYADTDTQKDEMMKDLYNSLVTNEGALPEDSFMKRTFDHSMTGGYAKMVGDAANIGGSMRLTDKGFKYEGDILPLNSNEIDIFSKVMRRRSAEDRDKSFVEKTLETMMSLAIDGPLIAASGAAAAGIMKAGGPIVRAMMASNQIGLRVSSQLIQQGINFNILGIPQTAESVKDFGLNAGISQIWHNVAMGAFATATGFAGKGVVNGLGISSRVIKEQLRRNPALAKELGAVGGGLFFGTGTSLIAGESWEDALSTGLAFAGTHMANPKAYKEVLRQAKQNNVRVRLSDTSTRDDISVDNYFVQEIDGSVYKINSHKFNMEGKIEKTSTEKIEITEENDSQYPYINEVQSANSKSFSRLLSMERLLVARKELIDRWISDGSLSKKKYENNKGQYDMLASDIAISVAGDKIKLTQKMSIPDNESLNDKMISFSNEFKVPYIKIKELLLNNMEEYNKNPDAIIKEMTKFMPADKPTSLKPGGINKISGPKTEEELKKEWEPKLTEPVQRMVDIFEELKRINDTKLDQILVNKAIDDLSKEELLKNIKDKKNISKTPKLSRSDELKERMKNRVPKKEISDLHNKFIEEGYSENESVNIISSLSKEERQFILSDGSKGIEITDTRLKEYANEPVIEEKKVSKSKGTIKEKENKPVQKKDGGEDVAGKRGEKPTVEPVKGKEGKPATTEGLDKKSPDYEVAGLKEISGVDQSSEKEKFDKLLNKIFTKTGEESVELTPDEISAKLSKLDSYSDDMDMSIRNVNRQIDRIRDETSKITTDNDKPMSERIAAKKLSRKEIKSLKDIILVKERNLALTKDVRKKLSKEVPIEEGKDIRDKISTSTEPISKDIYPTTDSGGTEISSRKITIARNKASQRELGDQWLNFAIDIGISKYVAPIASLLDKLRVQVLRSSPKDEVKGTSFYNSMYRHIYLSSKENTPYSATVAFMHEAMHAFSVDSRLSTKSYRDWYNDTIGTEFKQIRTAVRTAYDNLGEVKNTRLKHFMEYFLDPFKNENNRDVRDSAQFLIEMASVGFSDPDVMAFLSGIKSPIKVTGEKNNPNSVFEWFNKTRKLIMSKIVTLLGKDKVDDNVLDAMYEIMDRAVDKLSEQNKDLLDIKAERDLSTVTDMDYLKQEVKLMDLKLNQLGSDPLQVNLAKGLSKRKLDANKRINDLEKDNKNPDELVEINPRDIGTVEPGDKNGVSLDQSYGQFELGGVFQQSDKILRNIYKDDSKSISVKSVRESNRSRDESDYMVADRTLSNESELSNAKQLFEETSKVSEVLSNRQDRSIWAKSLKDKFAKGRGGFKNYLKYNLPPVHFAEISPKFREIWEHGEAVKSTTAKSINRILQSEKFWHNESKWNKLNEEEKNMFLNKVKEYEIGVFTGDFERKTWDEFREWSGINNSSEQMNRVFDAYRSSLEEATNVMIDGYAESLVSFGKDIGRELTKDQVINELESLKGYVYEDTVEMAQREVDTYKKSQKKKRDNVYRDNGKKAGKSFDKTMANKIKEIEEGSLRKSLEDQIQADDSFKRQIGRRIVEGRYKDWGSYFYYNGSRPTNPDTFIIKAKRSSAMDDGLKEHYQFSNFGDYQTYAETRQEFEAVKEVLRNQGYEIVEEGTFQIKDIIADKSYRSKLTELQLMELANRGHIDLNDDIIKKLINSTKDGVNVHEVNKRYIPGMKYTEKEFKNQLTRFVREAVYSGSRPYHLKSMDLKIKEWESEINRTIGNMSELEKKDILGQYKYARGYLNQMKQPEKTWIDEVRFAGITWQVGIMKPAFLFQQATQVFQTGLAQMISTAKNFGLTTGDAYGAFGNAMGESLYIRAGLKSLRMGKTIEESVDSRSYATDKERELFTEKLKVMQELEWAEKLAPTGITEMTSLSPELDYGNQSGVKKHYEGFKRATAYLGKGVERWSRMQVASGFYDIAYKKGLRGDMLFKFISDNVDKAMGEWGKGGRAPILYSRKANNVDNQFIHGIRKGLMTYKTFSFYNYGQWAELIRGKQYSALYNKTMIGAGLHGIYAFPLMSGMFALVDAFTDDDTSVDYEMLKLSDELDKIVPNMGKVMSKGVSTLAGIDMSSMFAEDTPLISDVYARSFGNTWEDKANNMLQGASIGFARDMIESARDLVMIGVDSIIKNPVSTIDDNEKAIKIIKKMSPIVVRNIWTAMTWEKDGVEYRDNKIISRDDLTSLDIALKTLSFPIEKVRRSYVETKYDALANYNYYNGMEKAAIQHIKDIRKSDIPNEAKINEVRRFIKKKNEYRSKALSLKREAMRIKRYRKIK